MNGQDARRPRRFSPGYLLRISHQRRKVGPLTVRDWPDAADYCSMLRIRPKPLQFFEPIDYRGYWR